MKFLFMLDASFLRKVVKICERFIAEFVYDFG